MSLIKCLYDESFTRRVRETETKEREYEIVWRAEVDYADYFGTEVLQLARAATPTPGRYDPVHRVGDDYSFLSGDYGGLVVDERSECTEVNCELEDDRNPFIWIIRANFAPPGAGGKLSFLGPKPVNPLRWPVEHWVEYSEDRVVVERAICLTQLDHLLRGPTHFASEGGPIVNAAGQQTVDPQTDVAHRMILCSQVYYPDPIYCIGLMNQFEGTVHGPSDFVGGESPTFPNFNPAFPSLMGSPHFVWRFMLATHEKAEYKTLTGEEAEEEEEDEVTIKYYTTIIKLERKRGSQIALQKKVGETVTQNTIWSGWIREVLNNGQTCFRKVEDEYLGQDLWVMDPRYSPTTQTDGRKMLLPTTALQMKEDAVLLSYEDTRTGPTSPRPLPTIDDIIEVETSEPVNLHLDGTQITDPEEPANHIQYLSLTPANYFDITDYFGNPIYPLNVTIPTFPLIPPP